MVTKKHLVRCQTQYNHVHSAVSGSYDPDSLRAFMSLWTSLDMELDENKRNRNHVYHTYKCRLYIQR